MARYLLHRRERGYRILLSWQVTLDVAGAVRPGSQSAVTQCGLGQANGEGSQRYNCTTHTMEYCNGTRWTATTPIMLAHGTVNIVDPADSNVHCINITFTSWSGQVSANGNIYYPAGDSWQWAHWTVDFQKYGIRKTGRASYVWTQEADGHGPVGAEWISYVI